MVSVKKSLADILGREYMSRIVDIAEKIYGMQPEEAKRLAYAQVEFFPEKFSAKMDELLEKVGRKVTDGMDSVNPGAATNAFRNSTHSSASPLGGLGYLRIGEDGRVYLASKSEHYHTPLGHNFPGYRLIDNARALGITNATHNNTRGYITRLLEVELVKAANGVRQDDVAETERILSSREPHVLNRVINLETGSLACEAGVKMMLARFYKLDETFPEPVYGGRTPVFFVMGDHEGGKKANYHGTTVFTQVMRGLWPGIYDKFADAGVMEVCPVKINDIEDFRKKIEINNRPPYKVAGFIHEIILMNYGGIRLSEEFLREAYRLCHENDVPTMCDEIQSCMWYPGMFLFREYGLNPDFVIIGKGFPGGQYAASKIITTYPCDNLNQFGALVTNGQEEPASLSYLITMAFAEENASEIRKAGDYYGSKLRMVAKRHGDLIDAIEGEGLLRAIFFKQVEYAVQFANFLNGSCIDVSAQTYKAKCPPAALTKPPIIATEKMIDFLIAKMDEALKSINAG